MPHGVLLNDSQDLASKQALADEGASRMIEFSEAAAHFPVFPLPLPMVPSETPVISVLPATPPTEPASNPPTVVANEASPTALLAFIEPAQQDDDNSSDLLDTQPPVKLQRRINRLVKRRSASQLRRDSEESAEGSSIADTDEGSISSYATALDNGIPDVESSYIQGLLFLRQLFSAAPPFHVLIR